MSSANLNYKIKDMEKDMNLLKKDIKLVLENHLPHLQNSVTEMNGKIDNLANKVNTAVGINVVMIIAGVIGVILLIK